jgi:hypothetical protein
MKKHRLRGWVQRWDGQAIPQQKVHETFSGPDPKIKTAQRAVHRYNSWSMPAVGSYLQSTRHYLVDGGGERAEPHYGISPVPSRLAQLDWIRQRTGKTIPELEVWRLFCDHHDPLRDTGQKAIRRYNAWGLPLGFPRLQEVWHYREYGSSEYEECHRLWLSRSDE